MRVVNPYSGIDFANAVMVKGISHEHIFSTAQLKKAYDRGIRYFACVNYQPAVPAAPSLDGWSGTYKIWNFFDVSDAYPTGGIGGTDVYDPATARAKVPDQNGLRVTGLVISYKVSGYDMVYEKFIGAEWSTDDEDWESVSAGELDSALTLKDATYNGHCDDFTAENGDEVEVSTLPALGNAEHALLKRSNGTVASSHFNVLGNLFSEACVVQPLGYPRSFVNAHPYFNMADVESVYTQQLQFPGKVFGTLNHSYNVALLEEYYRNGRGLFKAMETFNQGFTKEANQMFRDAYDTMLRNGHRLFNVAVADWQDDIEIVGYTGQDMSGYVKECDFTRGCNVLFVPANYDSLTKSEKVEAGLESYISGAFYASGLGNYQIQDLSFSNGQVHFRVSGGPSKLVIVTNKGKTTLANQSEVNVKIASGLTYIRFEAYYYADPTDMDFIFTNPIWFEDNNGGAARNLLLLGI